jgi:hypothetical protein
MALQPMSGEARLAHLPPTIDDKQPSLSSFPLPLQKPKFNSKDSAVRDCGCVTLTVHVVKDRTERVRTWPMDFWGARFYPAVEAEFPRHDRGG